MLRIRFELEDMARLRLAPGGVAGMIESVYSSTHLTARRVPAELTAVAGRVRGRLGTANVGPLLDLLRPTDATDRTPGFLLRRTSDPVEFVDHFMRLPARRLRADLATRSVLTPYQRRLADGDRAARADLATAVTDYHRAFATVLPEVRRLVTADLGRRRSVLAEHGSGALLTTLHPDIRWRPPWLEVDIPTDGDLELAGRPVTLTPSMFMRDRPRVLGVPDGPCFVTFPVVGRLLPTTADSGDPLTELLGRTRAAVVRAIGDGCSNGELATRTGTSGSTASEHAAVLRRAGLVTTQRTGRSVHHRLTPLGEQTRTADPR